MSYKVFINPGHDLALDPGAVNEEMNVTEAEIVAVVGEKVSGYLQQVGIETFVMQNDNLAGEEGYRYNESVCATCNKGKYDIFVSIHCNAAASSYANGAECFYYPSSKTGPALAEAIQMQIINSVDVDDRGIKGANFSVLKNTNCVACLVEMGFMTNPYDVKMLINNKDDFARAIARGITDYILSVKDE